MAFDPYYSRPEVSNSDLTALKYKLFPQLNFVSENAKLEAFRKGTLVDALITEPKAFNYYKKSVGDYIYTDDEIKRAATGSHIFAGGQLKLQDAIEDMKFTIYL